MRGLSNIYTHDGQHDSNTDHALKVQELPEPIHTCHDNHPCYQWPDMLYAARHILRAHSNNKPVNNNNHFKSIHLTLLGEEDPSFVSIHYDGQYMWNSGLRPSIRESPTVILI